MATSTRPIPAGWQCDPAQCEFLGMRDDGAEMWRIGTEAYSHFDGHTSWQCTMAALPTYRKVRPITLPL